MSDDSGDTGVRSVTRALDLLALFDGPDRVFTVRELTDATGLAKTTVLRLVATLELRGLLWNHPDGHVCAGPGLLRWASLGRAAWELPAAARDVMRGLVAETAETANLYVRSATARVCVAKEEGPQNLRHHVPVGQPVPLWAGAASKILLQDGDPALLARVAALAPADTTPEALADQVAAAARDGYAISHGERELGVSGIAAPVRDSEGRVTAAIALGGPTVRFTAECIPGFVSAVAAAGARMSDIGLFPPPGGAAPQDAAPQETED
ncbi:IclR family transcriptional regulator [Murinocardiopsis flavida]|uniref:IclR family transcriptional regulator n=1 Tax=Murinocardiopsis flavida TaxID=645275 RepID=UPI001FE94F29|nr:IclR family transcriptional regulator [Murinocardiopsis flavida]